MSLRMPRDRLGEKLSNLKSLALVTPASTARNTHYFLGFNKKNAILRYNSIAKSKSKEKRLFYMKYELFRP